MSFLASSSRNPTASSSSLVFVRHVSGAHRYPKKRTPAPKLQKTRSPHFPRLPLPSSGAAQPHPPDLTEYVPSTSAVKLEGSSMELRHSPPSSAPSYTTGNMPDMLTWLGGQSVRLTGEERAPMLRKATASAAGVVDGWSDDVKARIRELRQQGMSRNSIAQQLGINQDHARLIARVAPQSPELAREDAEVSANDKEWWSYKKRLAREIRTRRKLFW